MLTSSDRSRALVATRTCGNEALHAEMRLLFRQVFDIGMSTFKLKLGMFTMPKQTACGRSHRVCLSLHEYFVSLQEPSICFFDDFWESRALLRHVFPRHSCLSILSSSLRHRCVCLGVAFLAMTAGNRIASRISSTTTCPRPSKSGQLTKLRLQRGEEREGRQAHRVQSEAVDPRGATGLSERPVCHANFGALKRTFDCNR